MTCSVITWQCQNICFKRPTLDLTQCIKSYPLCKHSDLLQWDNLVKLLSNCLYGAILCVDQTRLKSDKPESGDSARKRKINWRTRRHGKHTDTGHHKQTTTLTLSHRTIMFQFRSWDSSWCLKPLRRDVSLSRDSEWPRSRVSSVLTALISWMEKMLTLMAWSIYWQ